MQPVPSLEIISQLFAAAGLEKYWSNYEQYVKPGFLLEPMLTPEEQIPVGSTKIGGHPDVPANFKWPDWEGSRWVSLRKSI
ncbi:hypothetical protein PCCS19_35700 [Paenibacillus sp. CCS19]|uniref:hypothetical protein n=1 Tax=Paenibacillus sp. CCS19 TaxID=3158387 RepID=UPI00256CD615|nr:hypothetical protein [Paenibacillus cellulosilyticus]GMK40514.1 hypothetical protein PCCS19_35700 [Paenibacillus cellulosilyticus]